MIARHTLDLIPLPKQRLKYRPHSPRSEWRIIMHTDSPMIPVVKAKLLEGKRGLIVGIANDQSIAWGCAKAFRALGRGARRHLSQ